MNTRPPETFFTDEPLTEAQVDRMANAIIDLETQGDIETARAVIRDAAKHDIRVLKRLRELREVVSLLSHRPSVPDFIGPVLAQADRERPFLSRFRRTRISAARAAVGAGVLVALTLVAMVQRLYPGATTPGPSQPVVTTMVEASSTESRAAAHNLASTVESLATGIVDPLTSAIRGQGSPLSFGDTSKYDYAAGAGTPLAGVGSGGDQRGFSGNRVVEVIEPGARSPLANFPAVASIERSRPDLLGFGLSPLGIFRAPSVLHPGRFCRVHSLPSIAAPLGAERKGECTCEHLSTP